MLRVLVVSGKWGCVLGMGGCAIFTPRPIQEMSQAAAAIRAAQEVRAEVLFPEKMAEANESFFRAQQQYRLKNFYEAKQQAERSRLLAEESELLSLEKGGDRSSVPILDPYADSLALKPSPGNREPSSVVSVKGEEASSSVPGTLASDYEEKQKREETHRLELEKIRAQKDTAALPEK